MELNGILFVVLTGLKVTLHCIGVEAENSEADILKYGQLKPNLSAWLDATNLGVVTL